MHTSFHVHAFTGRMVHLLGSGPDLHSGHLPHAEQREAIERPAGHDLLSLQGQPSPSPPLPGPEEYGEGNVVLGDSHGVRRPGYAALATYQPWNLGPVT